MKSGHIQKRKSKKQKSITAFELEEFPFEKQFADFIQKINRLKAERDTIEGSRKEYISTVPLYSLYEKSFGTSTLSDGAISYRLRHIKHEDFPNDFLILSDTGGSWEAKYFVNRLNKELLKKIYLPQVEANLNHIKELTSLYNEDVRWMHELDDSEDEDDDEI